MDIKERVDFFEWLLKNYERLDVCINDDTEYHYRKYSIIPQINEFLNYDYKNLVVNELYKDYLIESKKALT